MKDRPEAMVRMSRVYALLVIFLLCSVGMIARAVNLQVMETEFLQEQGKARYLREVGIPTTRGIISDRNGEALAVSTPVDSVWVNPRELLQVPEKIRPLAQVLGADPDDIERKLNQRSAREFVWLKRRLHPETAAKVEALKIPGVSLQKEYRRFYPAGEVAAHLIGFTNIDDVGQEGLELTYNEWLSGEAGSKRVFKDRLGRTIEEVELIRAASPGNDLQLSIDRRLQYLAYRELKRTVLRHGAHSGSVVVLDSDTSEVLAIVNYPAYNPNKPGTEDSDGLRNRAVTDVFEPGSVMKPFAVTSVLEHGVAGAGTIIDTSPGTMRISGHTIRDTHDYGVLDVTGLLTKSSNVGVATLALELEAEQMWDTYNRYGFGEATGTGFPGESAGVLRNHRRWRRLEQATISYGYGVSATALQIAQAYAVIANDGRLRHPTFIREAINPAMSVVDPALARQVAAMLETVTGPEGTGKQARVANYRISGKTGTSRKASASGYANRYIASFAGFAPSSDPRLICVAVINDPTGDFYYGGQVAAPLFAEVVGGALRLMNVPPDDYSGLMVQSTESAGGPDR